MRITTALRPHKFITLLLLSALLVALSCTALFICRTCVMQWETQALLSVLRSAVSEKCAAVSAISDERISALTAVAGILSGYQDTQRKSRLASLLGNKFCPILCYADAQGMLYLPDGRIRAVSLERFYTNALSGRAFSGRLPYAFLEGASVVHAVPVRTGDNTDGVLCDFGTERDLGQMLADRQFDGGAAYCLVDRNGVVQFSVDNRLPAGSDLFAELANVAESASGGEKSDAGAHAENAAANAAYAAFVAALFAGRSDALILEMNDGQGFFAVCPTAFADMFLTGVMWPKITGAVRMGPMGTLYILFAVLLAFGLLLLACQAMLERRWLFALSATQARAYAQLSERARTDRLTGLLNRDALEQEIKLFLASEGRYGFHALLLIDLDNFKAVNDTFGHQDGDAVLAAMAQKMLSRFRSGDVIGRLGGDEFLLLLKNVGDAATVEKIAAGLCDVLDENHGGSVHVTGSIGITLCPGGRADYSTLYREADDALYTAKRAGKNRFAFFDGQSAPK